MLCSISKCSQPKVELLSIASLTLKKIISVTHVFQWLLIMVNTFHTHLSLYMNAVKPLSSNPQGTRKKRLLN